MTLIGAKISTMNSSEGSTGVIPPSSDWILSSGSWDDGGDWVDTETWNDGV